MPETVVSNSLDTTASFKPRQGGEVAPPDHTELQVKFLNHEEQEIANEEARKEDKSNESWKYKLRGHLSTWGFCEAPPPVERNIVYQPQWAIENSIHYPPNKVANTKYNFLTFFPFVLYAQFRYFANLYFLFVALTQLFPPLKVGFLFTYVAPLAFVICVTMLKELLDDLQRSKADNQANNTRYQRLNPDGSLSDIRSSEIRVGDCIIVGQNQKIPADSIILRTTEKSGACFIRTDQLDGETDWKLRTAVTLTQKLPQDKDVFGLDVGIYAEAPHKAIYEFIGQLTANTASGPEPLGLDNTAWCNTVVATGTCVCAVIYTGRETRSALNASFPPTKIALLDMEINFLSKVLCVFMVLLSLFLVFMSFNFYFYAVLVNTVRYLLLFSSIIPISLRVSLDMAKTVYSKFIEFDSRIPNTIVRNSNLPEELGRINFLFSDKTGTLTSNEMFFRRLYLGSSFKFSHESVDDISTHLKTFYTDPETYSVPKVDVTNNRKKKRKAGKNAKEGAADGTGEKDKAQPMGTLPFNTMQNEAQVHRAIECIATCHNVTPVDDEDGMVEYQASSPDEVAMVKFTEMVGVQLFERDINTMKLKLPDGELASFTVLQNFPFTSETKRMGIILRNDETEDIYFYMKGADVVMKNIVMPSNWLEEECSNLAVDGYRTLVFGYKVLTPKEYADFEANLKAAKAAIENREKKVANVMSSLEKGLELVGITGVEDLLQQDVQQSLEDLREAGIKIWMLTGDKVETAICIARSTKLFDRRTNIHTIIAKTSLELEAQLNDFAREVNFSGAGNSAIVMDGNTLAIALRDMDARFVIEASRCGAVVICRCSPTQKAEVVNVVRKYNPMARTAAIGDGGNDVSMIQAAHVGLGIVGKEGKHASLAADFSITQFSFCKPLIMWHGRQCYLRSAALSQFIFHRGMTISIIQAVFSAIFSFQSLPIYTGWLLVGYATAYTTFPILCLILDQDITYSTALQFPILYKELQKGRALGFKAFLIWMFISLYQGGLIMILALLLFEGTFINIVAISFTALILTELAMVLYSIHISPRTPLLIMAELLSLSIYLVSMVVLKSQFDAEFVFTFEFFTKVAIITSLACLPVYLCDAIYSAVYPAMTKKLEAKETVVRLGGILPLGKE